MSKARLSCPARTCTQSGAAKTKRWLLEFPVRENYVDPLMGWVGAGSTLYEKKLWFSSKEAALSYVQAHHISCDILEPEGPTLRPKAYGDHFKADRILK